MSTDSWQGVATVYGPPSSMGSKRIGRNGAGKPIVLDVKDARLRSWQQDMRMAMLASKPEAPLACPVQVVVAVWFDRPKYHFGTGKNADRLKESAPLHHTSKPDADKILRAALDCGKGIWWRDDAQVAQVTVFKFYATGRPPQTQVIASAMPGPAPTHNASTTPHNGQQAPSRVGCGQSASKSAAGADLALRKPERMNADEH